MRNIKLTIEYDGTNFYGWQKQPDKRTVQEEIENCLTAILKETVSINGAGRTDAGVHAIAQVANFKTDKTIGTKELYMAINSIISKDVTILSVEEAPEDFHARKSAKAKHYRYVVNNAKVHSALNMNREYVFKYNLSDEVLQMAAKDLIGKHDFAAFKSSGSNVEDTVREIYNVSVNRMGNRIIIDVVGNGFMYNMVRIIVGTLLDIGSGKLDVCTIKNMIETKDRTLGGQTVPACGLYMVEVLY